MRLPVPIRDFLFDHAVEGGLVAAALAAIVEMAVVGPALMDAPLWSWFIAPAVAGVAAFAGLKRL